MYVTWLENCYPWSLHWSDAVWFRFCPVGRSFFSPEFSRTRDLGEGLECWRGFYQSIRPTQMGLSLNIGIVFVYLPNSPDTFLHSFNIICLWGFLFICIVFLLTDMSSTAFFEPLPVNEFVGKLLGKNIPKYLVDAERIKVLFVNKHFYSIYKMVNHPPLFLCM